MESFTPTSARKSNTKKEGKSVSMTPENPQSFVAFLNKTLSSIDTSLFEQCEPPNLVLSSCVCYYKSSTLTDLSEGEKVSLKQGIFHRSSTNKCFSGGGWAGSGDPMIQDTNEMRYE